MAQGPPRAPAAAAAAAGPISYPVGKRTRQGRCIILVHDALLIQVCRSRLIPSSLFQSRVSVTWLMPRHGDRGTLHSCRLRRGLLLLLLPLLLLLLLLLPPPPPPPLPPPLLLLRLYVKGRTRGCVIWCSAAVPVLQESFNYCNCIV